MLEIGLFVLFVSALSCLLQEKLKVPSSATCVTIALIGKGLGYGGLIVGSATFDGILLLLLPLLLAVDILHLRLSDLKTHALSLFYVAGISVALSVAAGVLLNTWVLPDYDISVPSLVMLFCMVSATDPVAVSAVFSNYKVPHQLKVLAEGESLFNDATALVIFSVALMIETSPVPLSLGAIGLHSIKIVVFAVLIGLAVGMVGLWAIKQSRHPLTETCILLCVAFGSFYGAEVFHYSGILAVISALLVTNHVIMARIDEQASQGAEDRDEGRLYVSVDNHRQIMTNIHFAAMVGITVLFLSIGDIVDFDNLFVYWKEILAVFAASTVIRMVMMLKFSLISNQLSRMHNISLHWYKILVFAGVKGGLSILMLHLMPETFEHLALFEAIVVGVILLSTFIYPIMMTLVMKVHHQKFTQDSVLEQG
jgi:CPA1 family monovalent cation:H+ antiporter